MNRARHEAPLSRIRWGGAITAVTATLALVAIPGFARAEGPGNDTVSGSGATASQVIVNWTQGILDSSNNQITAANQDRTSKSSVWAFMYQQFQNLQVTISQTQDIGLQGISVSWTGAAPSFDTFGNLQSFLQIMECYGDATTGPTPEQCEYGSTGLLGNAPNTSIGGRTGPVCVASSPSLTNPPAGADGSGPVLGCDPQEPGTGTDHTAPCPGADCTPGDYTIPFVPVGDPTKPDYDNGSTTYYSRFNTNEVQQAYTNANGDGQQEFETLTNTQSSGLGCGQKESDGQPQGCWLVIVPRGLYEPNGYKANVGAGQSIQSSPLSATNWAQRIQVHLSYAPLPVFCPITSQQRATVGTQVVTRAVQSWQIALNQSANCTKVYGFSADTESTSTSQLADPNSGTGLAFTTIPIGTEASGGPPSNLPTILYAPVAITALGFGFNINSNGFDATPVKLTPLLVAKSLTQSYRQDLPSFYSPYNLPGPKWAQGNPLNLSTDPTFQALNTPAGSTVSTVPAVPSGPINPLVAADQSAVNAQPWQWIQGSSAAKTWLGGTPDKADGDMAVDPDYQAFNLGSGTASQTFPRAVQDDANVPCLKTPNLENPAQTVHRCTLDLIPYINNFDDASTQVLAANNPDSGGWDVSLIAPDGSQGWWDKFGVEPSGHVWMWAFDDTAEMTHYGLTEAQLCDDSGQNCVGPTSDSLTAAVQSAKADSSGLLHVDPASPGTGGYPLVDIVYAAVPTNQAADALKDYAGLISYAVGAGQTPGSAAGDLPPGYLPLTPALVSQAQAVVTKLQNLANATPSPSPSASTNPTPAASSTTTAGVLGGNGGSTTAPATSATTATASTAGSAGDGSTSGTSQSGTAVSGSGASAGTTHPAASPGGSLPTAAHPTPAPGTTATAAGGPVISMPPNQPAAAHTPGAMVGAVRWVLIVLIIAGGVCAILGTVLRSRFSLGRLASWPPPPWQRRGKPR